MNEPWWEGPVIVINDYWWAFLLVVVLALTTYFTRSYWQPLFGAEPAAELGTGDVQVTLTWDNINDLDLWVYDPDGTAIYFEQPISASGGQLDVDANRGCEVQNPTPVENIFWPTGAAPRGTFRIEVQYYQQCQSNNLINYHLRLLVDGQVTEYDGTIQNQDDRQVVATFER